MRHAANAEANAASWGGDKEMMMRPLTDSVFVKYFQIESWVGEAKEWEMVPSNVDGMYEKTVLPELRREKNPQVLEYWDARIKREEARAAATRLDYNVERFRNVRKPTLLWRRAKEYFALDMPNRGIAEMFALLKANPLHPDFESWSGELEAMLLPKPAATPVVAGAVAPTPTPSPAPAAP